METGPVVVVHLHHQLVARGEEVHHAVRVATEAGHVDREEAASTSSGGGGGGAGGGERRRKGEQGGEGGGREQWREGGRRGGGGGRKEGRKREERREGGGRGKEVVQIPYMYCKLVTAINAICTFVAPIVT